MTLSLDFFWRVYLVGCGPWPGTAPNTRELKVSTHVGGRRLTNRDQVGLKTHGQESKQSLNLPILRIIHDLKGIMVNKGRIHRELGKFL